MRRDILKHHEKVHMGEKSFACRMCQETFCKHHEKIYTGEGDVGQDLCQSEMSCKDTHDKSPLSAGSATRHSETSLVDTHKIKSLCLQDIRRDILKHQEKIHKGENPFACRMCDKTF